MDRFVVCRLFGACQVQVQKNGGAKIGTESNKIEAGNLLKRVILETQQNAIATERSAAMRSGNEIIRAITMFSADSMKVIGRVIDAIGELSVTKAKLRAMNSADVKATLTTKMTTARKKVFRSITALVTSALFMVGVAQLFRWLYGKDKDDDEETAANAAVVDFVGNLLGGLPLLRDVYARIAEGYDIDNYAYSALNDFLDSTMRVFEGTKNLVSGDATTQQLAAGVKSMLYSVGQLLGIPTRNIYNVGYGLTKRFSPTTAYKIDSVFYKKNYLTDLEKAISAGDTDMMMLLMNLVLDDRIADSTASDMVKEKLAYLYGKGYNVLPRIVGETVTYNNTDIPLTETQTKAFRNMYTLAMKDIDTMMGTGLLDKLTDENQAKTIKQVYDAYYYNALTDLVGRDERTVVGKLYKWIDIGKLSLTMTELAKVTSDKDATGETLTGSKKKNVIRTLLNQDLTDAERLLILCYRGYTIRDGDYRNWTAARAKRVLLSYILGLSATKAEKAEMAQACGFEVKNGKIMRDF